MIHSHNLKMDINHFETGQNTKGDNSNEKRDSSYKLS